MLEDITNFKTAVVDAFTEMKTDLLALYDALVSIPQKIREVLEGIFIPSEGYLEGKLDELRSNFVFIQDLTNVGLHFINFLQTSYGHEAPVIHIDLSRKSSGISWGNRIITMDFSWYAPYKPLVDNIVAGFIWLAFSMHVYRRIPDIIRGNSMTIGHIAGYKGGDEDDS